MSCEVFVYIFFSQGLFCFQGAKRLIQITLSVPLYVCVFALIIGIQRRRAIIFAPPPSEFLFFPWPLYLYALFLSIGSDELMTPLPSPPPSVKNVKIRENSEKIRGPPGIP